MGDTRGGWCVRPNALLAGRENAVQEDVTWVLENAPDGDFSAFKCFWQSNHFSLLHRSLKPRESHTEYYQLFFSHLLTSFSLSRGAYRSKCLYFLYTLYSTQTRAPAVKIPIDQRTWEAIVHYGQRASSEEAAMIQHLIASEAFSLGVFAGLKTICAEVPEPCEGKPRVDITAENCDFVTGLLDVEELETKSREYHFAKQRVVEGLRAHPDWFPPAPCAKSPIQERLDSTDPAPLLLSNPLLYLDLKVALDPVLPE